MQQAAGIRVHRAVVVKAESGCDGAGIGVKDFVFAAMTGSFLTAPLFAWMAMDTINSSLVPEDHRYGPLMRGLSWFGLVFLSGFSLLFIANAFLGLGA